MRRGLVSAAPDQYDGPWKNFVDDHLSQFIEFFVPEAYIEIDWTRKPVSLNTELRRLRRGNSAATGASIRFSRSTSRAAKRTGC